VSFGPKPRDWSIKMNKKERRLAMATALQSAASAMIVVDDISGNISAPGTNAFNKSLMAWGVGASEKAYVITKDANENVAKSARNIERVVQTDVSHLNVYDILNADKVIVEASALAHIPPFSARTAPRGNRLRASADTYNTLECFFGTTRPCN